MAHPAPPSAKRTSPQKAAAKPAKTIAVAAPAAGERTWTMTKETVKPAAQEFGTKATEILSKPGSVIVDTPRAFKTLPSMALK